MDVQTIIVGIIILASGLYIAKIILGKIKSFSSDKSCNSDCGCGPASKTRNSFTQIKRD